MNTSLPPTRSALLQMRVRLGGRLPPVQNPSLIRVHQVTKSVPMKAQPGSIRRKLVQDYEETRKHKQVKKTRFVRFISPVKPHTNDLSSWWSGLESPQSRTTSLLR